MLHPRMQSQMGLAERCFQPILKRPVRVLLIILVAYSCLFTLYSLAPLAKPAVQGEQSTTGAVPSTVAVHSSKAINNETPSSALSEAAKAKLQEEADRREIEEYIKRSNEMKSKGKMDEALQELDAGLAKYPRSDRLWMYKAGWYFDQKNYAEAEKYYKKASEMNPDEVLHLSNIALCLVQQKKHREAIEYYRKALAIRPNDNQFISMAELLWKINDWTDWEKNMNKMMEITRSELKAGKKTIVSPFVALHMPFTAQELQKIAEAHSNAIRSRAMKSGPFDYNFENRTRTIGDKIRVGYVSYDFRNHAVGLVIQSVFGFHDKERFEIHAYNVNDGKKDNFKMDNIYNKIKDDVDFMWDIGGWDVKRAADKIYQDKIDILIDLGLFTAGHRMDIFAAKPAPIEMAMVGLACTTGAWWYDYFVVDPFTVPEKYRQYYTEKLVYMPHSYHVLDHQQLYPIKPAADRTANKLPTHRFLYCNHANNLRLNPVDFSHWANILKKVENSSLVLKYFNNDSASNMKENAKAFGLRVDDTMDSQLFFLPGASIHDHISRKSMCDVYLDIHFYNGHSTTADILWAGVPMATYPGESVASRAAGAFATGLGLPEMIAESWEEFEDLAVRYATDHEFYRATRTKLENARTTAPLYDTKRWVRNLENGFEQMIDKLENGLPPSDIIVRDQGSQRG